MLSDREAQINRRLRSHEFMIAASPASLHTGKQTFYERHSRKQSNNIDGCDYKQVTGGSSSNR
jgi:hypothetical protein